ncbi:MAG: hypothetical protein COB22_07760 [Cycloclasticus sp.]|nr:MAG: hypothetical protein COB22_07760 [Cycloclasticus sp.]
MDGLGLNKLARNVGSTLGRQFVSGLLQLVTVVVIARVYGAAINGSYAIALLLPSMLATFLNLGIGPANVYYLGSSQVTSRKAFLTASKFVVLLSVIGLILGGFLVELKAEAFFPGIHPLALWLGLLGFPISLMQGFISSIFQGLQKFKEFNLVLLVQPAIMLVLVVSLVLLENNELYLLVVAYLAAGAITLLLSYWVLKTNIGDTRVELEDGYSKKVISYGYKAHLSNIMAFFNYKADIFLVNFFLNPASAGVYVIAVQLSERLWVFSQAISTVLLPKLSELSSDEEKRKQITPLITRFTLFFTVLITVVFALVASPFISIVFGSEYRGVLTPLLILLPGIVLTSGSRILSNDLAARGKPELNLYVAIVVVFCNVVGNLILIPKFGLIGAAIATTVAYCINFILKVFMYRNFSTVPIRNLIWVKVDDLERLWAFLRKTRVAS